MSGAHISTSKVRSNGFQSEANCKAACVLETRELNILSLNVCGLKSKLSTPEFLDLCRKNDVLCFSETHCDEVDMEFVKKSFNKIGFSVVYRTRSVLCNYKSGGIILAAKKELKPLWKTVPVKSEAFVSIIIDKSYLGLQKHVVISSVCVPPSSSRYSSVELFDDLDKFLLDYSDGDYYKVLTGDFNACTGIHADIIDVSGIDGEDNTLREVIDVTESMQWLGIPVDRYSKDTSAANSYGTNFITVM